MPNSITAVANAPVRLFYYFNPVWQSLYYCRAVPISCFLPICWRPRPTALLSLFFRIDMAPLYWVCSYSQKVGKFNDRKKRKDLFLYQNLEMYPIPNTYERKELGLKIKEKEHGWREEKIRHGYRQSQLGWMWLFVFCSIHIESVLLHITVVVAQRRFHYRWVVKLVFVKEILVRPMSSSAT